MNKNWITKWKIPYQFLKLESNTEGQPGTFLLENSASGLSAGNIISNVNVTEFGGEGVDQMGKDDIQTTVTITPFNPYADYNEDTGQFTQWKTLKIN